MAISKTFLPSSTSDVVGHLAESSRGFVNQAAATAGPALESVRETADDVISNVAARAAKMQKAQRRMMLNASDRVRAHPFAALGIALAAGWLVSRLMRSEP